MKAGEFLHRWMEKLLEGMRKLEAAGKDDAALALRHVISTFEETAEEAEKRK